MTKKRKKRDVVKYPGLNKTLFSKVKQEYHDIDYIDQLSDKEKSYLSQFMGEYLGAQLNEDTLKNKYNRKAKHKSKKHRKDCFDRNNARQRDIYGLGRAMGCLDDYDSSHVADYLEYLSEEETSGYEDEMIKKIDEDLE